MKLGRITGRVVSTIKVDSFEGLKFVLVQPLDEKLENAGDPIVAADKLGADIGQLIYYETSKEAGRILETTMNPLDAAVMGIVDDLTLNT